MEPPPTADLRTRLPDLIVLLVLGANLVLNPPNLRFLSALDTWPPRLSGDVLGGVALALGTLLVLAYAWVMGGGRAGRDGLRLTVLLAFAFLWIALPLAADAAARATLGLVRDGHFMSIPHDGGVLQTEAALGFLLDGHNPYAAYYGGTAMAASPHSAPALWRALGLTENPAFSFFPYPPGTLFVSLPFYLAGRLVHAYDQRVVYLAALATLAWVGWQVPRDRQLRPLAVALLVLAPWAVPFVIQGYNDVLCVLFLMAMAVALRRGSVGWAGLWLALACGAKQLAWPGVPLYFTWLWTRTAAGPRGARALELTRRAAPFLVAAAVLFVPFLIWSPGAFLRCLVVAQTHEYPTRVGGLGLANVLVAAGLVRGSLGWTLNDVLQPVVALAALAWGMRAVLRGGGAAVALRAHALVVVLLLLLSRHFAPSYLVLPAALFVAALVIEEPAPSP